MPPAKRFDHVGVTVSDLEAAVSFFRLIGLEPDAEPFVVEGHFVSTVVGIEDTRVLNVTVRAPDGGTGVELSQFFQPEGLPARRTPPNQVGLCNIAFEVDDVHAVAERVGAEGFALVGGVADWEDTWRMAYVRGPDDIIVSLAQRLT